jgi:hypothetical protein
MESLRVPASLLRRLVPVLSWLLGALGSAALGLAAGSWQWIAGRVDGDYVAGKVAPAVIAASAAQADAHHASGLADAHARELELLWRELVLLHAELEVQRSYPSQSAATRSGWVAQAKRYYGAAYDSEREDRSRANDPPSKTAERVMRLQWRPDR